MDIYQKIIEVAESIEADLIATRRDFHKHAETGWFEMRTSSLIARRLTDLGYEVLVGEDVCDKDARMGVPPEEKLEEHYEKAAAWGADPEFLPATKGGMTGVIGILRCGEGPTVALRFDIDALGVNESQEEDHLPYKEGFASINPGAMHACGHDGHGTIGLGVAKVLMEIKNELHGTVKLIFQPAEEGVRGAKSIVAKGHLDGVDYFIGSHVTSKKPEDTAQVICGSYGSLATCKYDVTYRGLAAHAGSSQHLGKNALLAAAAATLNLYAIPRHGKANSQINVGTLHAGSGRNVVADEAKMEIEVRGATTEVNNYMCAAAQRVLESCAQMYGCQIEIKLMGAADSLCSDEGFVSQVGQSCRAVGLQVKDGMIRSFGSEDVSYMMNRVQEQGGSATFMRVMTVCAGPAHNRKYDFGEEVLVNGVKGFCSAVYDIMK